MKLTKPEISSILIVLFHIVGLIGFLTPSLNPLFVKIVPFHLLLMMGLILYSHSHRNRDFWLFVLVTYFAGFLIEVFGVSTGYIFGSYQYGDTLGFKIAEVPLLIGVNWVILIYCTGVTIKKLAIQSHVLRSVMGAFFLVFLDFLIEPVAIKFDYWSWTGMNIPFQNYVAWFIFSFMMLLFFYARQFKKQNPAALVLLLSQLVFFAALNLWSF